MHHRHTVYCPALRQVFCQARTPHCTACPLRGECDYAMQNKRHLQVSRPRSISSNRLESEAEDFRAYLKQEQKVLKRYRPPDWRIMRKRIRSPEMKSLYHHTPDPLVMFEIQGSGDLCCIYMYIYVVHRQHGSLFACTSRMMNRGSEV